MSDQIYDQSTHSIHLGFGDVDTTVERYAQKYDQELVGDYLDNCHMDFEIVGAAEKANIYSIEN